MDWKRRPRTLRQEGLKVSQQRQTIVDVPLQIVKDKHATLCADLMVRLLTTDDQSEDGD